MKTQPGSLHHYLLGYVDPSDRLLLNTILDEMGRPSDLAAVKNSNQLMYAVSEYEWLPEILFLDLHLSCKDGQKCLTEIRSKKDFYDIPIVILSISTQREDIDFCYNEGANVYILRNISIEDRKKNYIQIFSADWTKYPKHGAKEKFVFSYIKA